MNSWQFWVLIAAVVVAALNILAKISELKAEIRATQYSIDKLFARLDDN